MSMKDKTLKTYVYLDVNKPTALDKVTYNECLRCKCERTSVHKPITHSSLYSIAGLCGL